MENGEELLLNGLLRLLSEGGSDQAIRDFLDDFHDNDIAEALTQVDEEARKRVYRILGYEGTAEVLPYMDNASDYLEELSPQQAAAVLGSMDADDAVDVLEDIDSEDRREELIALMDDESSEDIRLIVSFDESQVGHMMTTNYVTVPATATIKEAMRSLIDQAHENDNINTIYATDPQGRYAGAIELKDLIVAREGTPLDDLIAKGYPSVYAQARIDDVMDQLRDYAEDSIPVLNQRDEIIGVITATDIIEAVDDALGEDYAKLAGLTAEEDLHERLFASMKKRLPWLVLLLGLGMIVSSVVGVFEAVVAQVAIVVSFQSLILDMAGNVGTQSLAVTIRVLMDENISGREKLLFVGKEMRVGAVNGLLLGGLSFVFVGGYLSLAKGYALADALRIAACVGAALLLAMVISSAVGTLIPMFFHRLKVDPAVASGPLITTVNDLVAVVSYYGLAAILLANLHIS